MGSDRQVARRNSDGGVAIFCPACKSAHVFAIDKPNRSGARWTWNGSTDKPTFTPSMHVKTAETYEDGLPVDPKLRFCCHSFVRDGMIEFLSDCTHDFAGKTVPLEPF